MISMQTWAQFEEVVILPKGVSLTFELRGTDRSGGSVYGLRLHAKAPSEPQAAFALREARRCIRTILES